MVMTATFSLPMDNLVKEVQKKYRVNAEAILRKLALDLYAEIIIRTPVDTGRARANWNLTVNKPDFQTTTSRIPSTVTLSAKDFKGLPVVFIANGLAYVRELEHGRSNQAPQGFIKLSIEAIKNRGII